MLSPLARPFDISLSNGLRRACPPISRPLGPATHDLGPCNGEMKELKGKNVVEVSGVSGSGGAVVGAAGSGSFRYAKIPSGAKLLSEEAGFLRDGFAFAELLIQGRRAFCTSYLSDTFAPFDRLNDLKGGMRYMTARDGSLYVTTEGADGLYRRCLGGELEKIADFPALFTPQVLVEFPNGDIGVASNEVAMCFGPQGQVYEWDQFRKRELIPLVLPLKDGSLIALSPSGSLLRCTKDSIFEPFGPENAFGVHEIIQDDAGPTIATFSKRGSMNLFSLFRRDSLQSQFSTWGPELPVRQVLALADGSILFSTQRSLHLGFRDGRIVELPLSENSAHYNVLYLHKIDSDTIVCEPCFKRELTHRIYFVRACSLHPWPFSARDDASYSAENSGIKAIAKSYDGSYVMQRGRVIFRAASLGEPWTRVSSGDVTYARLGEDVSLWIEHTRNRSFAVFLSHGGTEQAISIKNERILWAGVSGDRTETALASYCGGSGNVWFDQWDGINEQG